MPLSLHHHLRQCRLLQLKARRWLEKGPLPQARNCQFRELPQIFAAPQQMSYTALTIHTSTDLMAYWNSLYPGKSIWNASCVPSLALLQKPTVNTQW